MVSVTLLRRRLRGLLARDNPLAPILKNSGYLVTSNVVTGLLALVQGILVARMLGAEEYGKLAIVMAVVSTINALTSSRLGEFIVKYLTEALEQGNIHRSAAIIKFSYLTEGFFSVFAFSLVLVLAPFLSVWFLKSNSETLIIIIFSFSLFANFLLETSTGILQTFKQFQTLAKLTFLQAILILALVLIAYLANAGILGVLYAYIIGAIVQTCLFQYIVLSELKKKLGSNWLKLPLSSLNGSWKLILSFLLSTNVGATMSLIAKTSDPLWLGYYRTPNEVGYFKLAVSISGLVVMPINALSQAFYPTIISLVSRRDKVKLKSYLYKGSLTASLWLIPASLFCYILSRMFLPLIYGTEFTPAVLIIAILLLGLIVLNSFFWLRPALLAIGRVATATHISIGLTCVKIVASVLFVPIYGYVASAMILSLLHVIGVGLSYLSYRKYSTEVL